MDRNAGGPGVARQFRRLLASSRTLRLDDDFDRRVRAENHVVMKVLLRVPMSNAPPDLAKKVKAEVVDQVSEIADQVGYHVLVATSAVLLKNRDSLGGPDDMVGSVSHVAPGLNGRATSQVSVSEIQTAPLDPRRPARQLARRQR